MDSTYFTILSEKNISIETERLKIYKMPISEKVFRDLYEIYSSKSNVLNYCEQHTDFLSSSKYFEKKITYFQNDLKSLISYVIELKENSKIIGVRNLMLDIRPTEIPGIIEPNFRGNVITEIIINENYWQKGYAYEASEAIFQLLKEYSLSYALTFVPKNNLKSELLDNKLGFLEFSLEFAIDKFKYYRECVYNTTNIEDKKIFVKGLDIYFPYNRD